MKRTRLKKKTRLKKSGKSKLSKAKREAWQVFSKWIRNRDKDVCITCNKDMTGSRASQAGHYISRRFNATLFDERNVNSQCMYCNMYKAGNIGVYTLKLIEKYGENIIKELTEKSQELKQWTVEELEGLKEKYGE